MENLENTLSVASNERIQKLMDEADKELVKIQPEIVYLEQCQKKLMELKEQQFKLNSLKMSLKSLLKTSDINLTSLSDDSLSNVLINVNDVKDNVIQNDSISEKSRKIFLPDQAVSEVKNYLRTKNNLNYEIFKAVVFNSGNATTQEIKQYLVENKIRQPNTGKTFDNVELKEISSRANYLVRKNILVSSEPGSFRSVFGWRSVD